MYFLGQLRSVPFENGRFVSCPPIYVCGHKVFLLGILGAVLSANARLHAQTSADRQPIISTDRPTIAVSSSVVPKGVLQFENGLSVTNSQGEYSLDVPQTAVRFGLFNKTELRLLAPEYFHGLLAGEAVPSGFEDMAICLKHQLGPIPGDFNLAVVFLVSLPSGAERLSSHTYDPGLQLPWARALSKCWTASGQAGFYWPTESGQSNFTGETTFALDRRLTPPWDMFVEYVGDFPQRGRSRQLLHYGSTHKIRARQQIDVQIAAGLTHAVPKFFLGSAIRLCFGWEGECGAKCTQNPRIAIMPADRVQIFRAEPRKCKGFTRK